MLEAGRVSITGSSDEGKCIFKYKLPTPLRQDQPALLRPDQPMPLRPDQPAPVRSDQPVPLGLDQSAPLRPDQLMPLRPDQRHLSGWASQYLLGQTSQRFSGLTSLRLLSGQNQGWERTFVPKKFRGIDSEWFPLFRGRKCSFRSIRSRVSTEFRRHGIPRNFLTSEVISPELSRKSLPYSAECQNVTSVDTLIRSSAEEPIPKLRTEWNWRENGRGNPHILDCFVATKVTPRKTFYGWRSQERKVAAKANGLL